MQIYYFKKTKATNYFIYFFEHFLSCFSPFFSDVKQRRSEQQWHIRDFEGIRRIRLRGEHLGPRTLKKTKTVDEISVVSQDSVLSGF